MSVLFVKMQMIIMKQIPDDEKTLNSWNSDSENWKLGVLCKITKYFYYNGK